MTSHYSQVELCYGELRTLIVRCELAPGTRLNEKSLMDRLRFGRTPVREALLRLSQERLVDTIPRSGYRVRPLNRKSIIDFFEVWVAIAPVIVTLAGGNLSDADRDMVENLAKQRAKLAEDDALGMSRVAAAFFEILVRAADNEPLAYVYHRLGAEMERIYLLFFSSKEGRRWLGSSQEIAAFNRVEDPAQAARLIRDRVLASREGVLALVGDQ